MILPGLVGGAADRCSSPAVACSLSIRPALTSPADPTARSYMICGRRDNHGPLAPTAQVAGNQCGLRCALCTQGGLCCVVGATKVAFVACYAPKAAFVAWWVQPRRPLLRGGCNQGGLCCVVGATKAAFVALYAPKAAF